MSPLLLATALLAAPLRASAAPRVSRGQPFGILLLAYDVDLAGRKELGGLRARLKGRAVESVTSADDRVGIQRAVDTLCAQHVGKIVVVPIETLSDAAWLGRAAFILGARESAAADRPDADTADIADRPLPPLRAPGKSSLRPTAASARVRSPVPVTLAPALDKSPLLVDILADRARALSMKPEREALVLIAIAPRSDRARKAWQISAQAVAAKIGAKAGFRETLALGVREGVRSDAQNKDRAQLRAELRALARKGRIVAVPLSPQAARVGQMFRRELGGLFAYRWDGKGVLGDRRLGEWIKSAAEQAAPLPDSRIFKESALGALGALGGKR